MKLQLITKGENMEAIACNICKEPAWNFMCMDCVSKDIKEFLPKDLKNPFQGFHKGFYSHFDSSLLVLNGSVYCVKCKSTKESPICPQCYANEAFNWIEDKNPSIAKRFSQIFSFSNPLDSSVENRKDREEDMGICDECGEYTDELVLSDGEWVCRECAIYSD